MHRSAWVPDRSRASGWPPQSFGDCDLMAFARETKVNPYSCCGIGGDPFLHAMKSVPDESQ